MAARSVPTQADRAFGSTILTTVSAFPTAVVCWPVGMAPQELYRGLPATDGEPSATARPSPAKVSSAIIGPQTTGGLSAPPPGLHPPDHPAAHSRNHLGPHAPATDLLPQAITPSPTPALLRAAAQATTEARSPPAQPSQAHGDMRCTSRKPASRLRTTLRRSTACRSTACRGAASRSTHPRKSTSPRQNSKLRTPPNRTAEATPPTAIPAAANRIAGKARTHLDEDGYSSPNREMSKILSIGRNYTVGPKSFKAAEI